MFIVNSLRINMLYSLALLLVSLSIFAFAQTPDRGDDIHKIDFRNFTYRPSCTNLSGEGQAKAVKVTNGTYSRPDPTDSLEFKIQGVVYGDLTGSGRDDAVVLTVCNTGGTGEFTEGFIYSMRSGQTKLVTNVPGGDRADGGISSAKVEKGLLKLDTFATDDGACCPQFVDTTTYKLTGNKLVQIGRSTRRKAE
jgi:hypothetical protein